MTEKWLSDEELTAKNAELENKLIDNGLEVRKPKKEIKIQKNKLKSHEIGD